jgi:NADPH:quinone reductase
MRAIEVASFGPPDVLRIRELPEPRPRPNQVVLAASVSDVLFVDTAIRSGRGAGYFPIRPPYVPGNGVGGTVTDVGEGVDRSWIGRRVVAHTGGASGTGGYAEHAAAELDATAPVPEDVDLLDATAVLHDGVTALRILETLDARSDVWVLVLGAAGGMGILLVQLLAARGTHVVGAARGRTKQELVAGAGAAVAIDYGEPGWAERVLEATAGQGVSIVLDGVGGELGAAAFTLLADGGHFSAHGAASGSFTPIDPEERRGRRVSVTTIADLQFAPGDRGRLLHAALEEVRAGRVAPLIGQSFPLGEAAKAHLAIETREALAKTLLTEP